MAVDAATGLKAVATRVLQELAAAAGPEARPGGLRVEEKDGAVVALGARGCGLRALPA